MSEPVSSTGATVVVTGAAITGLLSGPDAADIVVGAFIGSVIFVISARDFSLVIRSILFFTSFVVGLVSCDFFVALINSFLPGNVAATKLIGAIVSSAVSVRLLMALAKRAAEPTILGGHDDRLQ